MSFIENIRSFKIADLTGFVPVLVENRKIGYSRNDFAKIISGFNSTWQLTDKGLELSSELKTFDERTKAIDDTLAQRTTAGNHEFSGGDGYRIGEGTAVSALLFPERFGP